MINTPRRRAIRILLISLIVLLAVGAGGVVWFSLTYKQYVKAHLAEKVAKATDGVYTASINDIDINLFTRRLTVTGLEFWPDSTQQHVEKETGKHVATTIKLSVPRFQFDGVQIFQLLFNKKLSVNHVSICQGRLVVTAKERKVDSSKIVAEQKKKPALKMLMSDAIDILAPDIIFRYMAMDGDNLTCKLKGGNATLKEWAMDPEKKDTTNLLYAKIIAIDSSAFLFDKPSLLYSLKVSNLCLNSHDNKLQVRGFSIHPTVDNENFYRILGHRNTIWNTDIAYFELAGLNCGDVLHHNIVRALQLNVTAPHIDLFFNYLVPSKPTNMIHVDPPRVFLTLPIKIDIRAIAVKNGHVGYTEVSEKTKKEGKVFFDNIKISGSNLTNIDSIIAHNSELTATGDGILYNKSNVTVSLKLSLTNLDGDYVLEGHAKNIEAAQLRDPVEAIASIKVDSVQIHTLDFFIMGNQNYSQSRLNMHYDDLKISFMRPHFPILKNKPLVSGAANIFFLYKQNPEPNTAERTSSAYLERDVMAPFLGLIIKNLKIAAKEMIIKHPNTVSTLTNDKDLKTQHRSFFQRLFEGKGKKGK